VSPLESLHNDINATMVALGEIDEKTSTFQQQSGLSCPEGCGRCCHSPTVEASPSEMLPLAAELYRRGEAEVWLEKLENAEDVCVFFAKDPNSDWKGRCSVYPWRPSLCRLFGFSSRKNKNGRPELVKCSRMEKGELEKASAAVREGTATAPDTSLHAMGARMASPGQASQLQVEAMNINKALLMALKQYATLRYFADQS